MNEIFALAIVGAGLSALLELLKQRYPNASSQAKILSIVILSLGAAVVYRIFKDTNYWALFIQILLYANAIYTLLIRYVSAELKK